MSVNKKIGDREEITIEVIERGLRDEDCDVRQAAVRYCEQNMIKLPIIRTIEPLEKVYKKCVAGVIVVAEIPKDAEIRGSIDSKCRTNKAKIVDIIGDFCGEKIGISIWDRETTYCIGDEVIIEDFDRGFDECLTGYHFFCNKRLAENYN